jgi:hypothetical protein
MFPSGLIVLAVKIFRSWSPRKRLRVVAVCIGVVTLVVLLCLADAIFH